ncbi:pyrroline-5-carboxylate reductase [Kocuria koreensis]|jgi:pyrroline-5-carboxylate reductase|uniref:Pyrroline-5-carboxylate reductase n=1 Tax=Rothia koreensis TaxID=592378 RepID=A0A7K1LES1_9MICC|nr:pyrroline-5-carboxylate reductase [Rothia koreensis]MUN53676.1 pyrroline-5-carboxylate reductase [Rothia koreensis]
MSEPIITFLGTGSMNGSIMSGLLAGGTAPERVRATTRSAASARKLKESLPEDQRDVTVYSGEDNESANLDAVKDADVVLLGVKPKGILDLAAEIKDALADDALVISVAAGIDLAMLEGELRAGQPVIRSMPNTPSRVGRGVIALAAGTHCTPEQLKLAHEVLANSGTVLDVEEDQINAVTGVSGSGPAYAFFLAEAMQKAGEAMGLDSETARLLAKETVSGAGELLHADDADPEALRKAVSSPNGTTERAINVFAEGGLVELTEKAAKASASRGAEMVEEFRR